MTPLQRISRAALLASEGILTDGGHHKQWYLNEILKALIPTKAERGQILQYSADYMGAEGVAPEIDPGVRP